MSERSICGACGYKIRLDREEVVRVEAEGKSEIMHKDCLEDLHGTELLDYFGIDYEEVEIY